MKHQVSQAASVGWVVGEVVVLLSEPVESIGEDSGAHPIRIVRVQEDHSFDLDMDALKEVLFSDAVKDRKVVVVSVAGAFRKGKSFLLDYLLRFLNNKVGRGGGRDSDIPG